MEKNSKSVNNREKKGKIFGRLNNREKTVAVVFLAALLVGSWLPERIIVSSSPSLDHRVFFMAPVRKEKIRTGDYLVFRHKDTTFIHKGLNPKNDRLIKKVGCSPGEMLTTYSSKKYLCEQSLLGTALETDSEGNPLPAFQFTGPVPKNNYFMIGVNPRSFDSRYFGFVHADEILYKALPLW
jgi:type IV secretory pathway protease TraF